MITLIAFQAAANQVHVGLLAGERRNDGIGLLGRICNRSCAAALPALLRRGGLLLLLLTLPLLRALWLGLLPFTQILSAICVNCQHTINRQN